MARRNPLPTFTPGYHISAAYGSHHRGMTPAELRRAIREGSVPIEKRQASHCVVKCIPLDFIDAYYTKTRGISYTAIQRIKKADLDDLMNNPPS